MKTNFLFAILALIFVAGCQPKVEEKQEKEVKQERTVDLESLKDSISLVMDNYYKAYNSKDLETYSNLLADDGFFCGTDPGEFWSKNEVVDMVKQQFADTTFNWTFSPEKQEIKLSSDGRSAIIVNQYVVTELSPKIPLREITHLIKTENRWVINFTCYNFITENDNVEKLNKAL